MKNDQPWKDDNFIANMLQMADECPLCKKLFIADLSCGDMNVCKECKKSIEGETHEKT